jgi:TrkA domain protein
MAEVTETELPGVGVRYDFRTAAGPALGVLVHRSGRRDVLVYSADDPDACAATLVLEPEDARTLAELLGASRVAEGQVAQRLDVEGLVLEWIRVDPRSPWAGKSLKEAAVHSETGASVVAMVVEGRTMPAPRADDVLRPNATVVASGTREGIAALAARLRGV